ncbi:MAG: response regulator [Gemmataceae bacterium]
MPRHKVLVVDDNADSARMLAMLVRLGGHEVKAAVGGAEALAAVRDFTPGFAFLDLGMPLMDGFELARRLRLTPGLERVVLVAMTGFGDDDHQRRAREAGFDHHLVKPADPAEIEKLLAGAG